MIAANSQNCQCQSELIQPSTMRVQNAAPAKTQPMNAIAKRIMCIIAPTMRYRLNIHLHEASRRLSVSELVTAEGLFKVSVDPAPLPTNAKLVAIFDHASVVNGA
jgi:hypothetical protein